MPGGGDGENLGEVAQATWEAWHRLRVTLHSIQDFIALIRETLMYSYVGPPRASSTPPEAPSLLNLQYLTSLHFYWVAAACDLSCWLPIDFLRKAAGNIANE